MVLGLTFLIIGLTFALPIRLVPGEASGIAATTLSNETANVYACTAWAGWAHFIYAFRGQGRSLLVNRDAITLSRLGVFLFVLVAAIAGLVAIRSAIGPAVFGSLAWIYFIDHFIKAERSFQGSRPTHVSIYKRIAANYQVLMAFAWLSFVLLNVGEVIQRPWLLWLGTVVFGSAILILGGWQSLLQGRSRSPLLALFFVGEAAVWGVVGQYSGPVFLTGVYIFHIAAGSYFHYLGSYFYGADRSRGADRWLSPLAIVAVNLAVLALGFSVQSGDLLGWLRPLFGIEWFTLWVAVHLVASDVFPPLKSWPGFKSPAAVR